MSGREIGVSENEYRLALLVLSDAEVHRLTSIERCALLALILHRRDNSCISRLDAAIAKKLLRTVARSGRGRAGRGR